MEEICAGGIRQLLRNVIEGRYSNIGLREVEHRFIWIGLSRVPCRTMIPDQNLSPICTDDKYGIIRVVTVQRRITLPTALDHVIQSRNTLQRIIQLYIKGILGRRNAY